MVDDENTDAMPVCELLEPADDFIIAGVAVSLTTDFTDFLHGINYDELGIGMLPDKEIKLFIESVADLICHRCKVEFFTILHAVHHKHSALDSLVIVLQSKVEYRTLVDFIFP